MGLPGPGWAGSLGFRRCGRKMILPCYGRYVVGGMFRSRRPGFGVPSAYAVAHLVQAARLAESDVSFGRKIGFTIPDMRALYGERETISRPRACRRRRTLTLLVPQCLNRIHLRRPSGRKVPKHYPDSR